MLLRASSALLGQEVDLRVVTGQAAAGGGVENGELLVAFLEAVLDHDRGALDQRRQELMEEMGAEALVETAAVIANFTIADRIADATGTPLDESTAEARVGLASQLGIERFAP